MDLGEAPGAAGPPGLRGNNRGQLRGATTDIELWDDNDSHVEELIALTGDYRVARAAYEEAVKRRPGRIVTLRQKTRLLADSRRR